MPATLWSVSSVRSYVASKEMVSLPRKHGVEDVFTVLEQTSNCCSDTSKPSGRQYERQLAFAHEFDLNGGRWVEPAKSSSKRPGWQCRTSIRDRLAFYRPRSKRAESFVHRARATAIVCCRRWRRLDDTQNNRRVCRSAPEQLPHLRTVSDTIEIWFGK